MRDKTTGDSLVRTRGERGLSRGCRARSAGGPATGSVGGFRRSGFTLIELMIVITIIFILLGMAAGRYDRSVHRAREASLKTDLQVMRQAIDNYTMDKEAAPQSLDDLVNSQTPYLREIPMDPITHAKDWHTDFGDLALSPDQTNSG